VPGSSVAKQSMNSRAPGSSSSRSLRRTVRESSRGRGHPSSGSSRQRPVPQPFAGPPRAAARENRRRSPCRPSRPARWQGRRCRNRCRARGPQSPRRPRRTPAAGGRCPRARVGRHNRP
jgi:hypothetical protein